MLRLVPWRMMNALGSAVGRAMFWINGHHRRIVLDNLRQSNLGLTEAQVRSTARSCFRHFGSLFLSAVHLLHMKPEEVNRWVHVDGFEHWDAAQAAGKGFIVLTAHYGHWEAMAMGLAVSGRPVAAIGRRLKNPLLEAKLLTLRSRLGNRVIYKEGGVRDSIKELRAGRGTGFLMDQDATSKGIFVRFMGRWASTHASVALLVVKYQVPVLPVYSWPNADGTISARILPPLDLPHTGNTEQDIWTATQLMTWSLEARIHEDPRWWFWLHRRFKTLPSESLPLPPQEWQDAIQDRAPKR
ncbi:MAG: lysophospholipid acyltransferase family protein [Holophaga sp.]|nr:lysophospholipid acyltransferase family protein [Holophaga sp.]